MMATPVSQSLDNSQYLTDSQFADNNLMSQGTLDELTDLAGGSFDLSPSVLFQSNSQEDPVMRQMIDIQHGSLNHGILSAVILPSSHLPDSQASSGSQSENVQPDVPFPGRYDFSVTVDKKSSKQTNFSESRNQLFVSDDLQIGFDVKYDFQACKDVKLIAFLRHSETCDAGAPVKRCLKHVMEARNNREKGSKSRSDEPDAEEHVLISTDDKAVHFQDKLSRCKVAIPLRSPAPGCETVKKVFLFKCKNSDDFVHHKKKPSWTIIFELKTKSGETVGRQVMNVKVSACPQRDFHKVEGTTDGTGTRVKRKKSNSSSTASRPNKRLSAAAGAPSRTLGETELDDTEMNFGSQDEAHPYPDWVQQARNNFSHLFKAMRSPLSHQEKDFLQGIASVVDLQVKQFISFQSSFNAIQTASSSDFLKTEMGDDSTSADFLFENHAADHI